MIKFFSKKMTAARTQSTQEIIEEIHETFFTEVDRLLASALNKESEETLQSDLLSKAERLRRLGFGAAKETQLAVSEESRLEHIKSQNRKKVQLTAAIQYFSQKYPHYKFITEESVKRICNKYGLVYGKVGKYLGAVPEKNIRDMEAFSIMAEDKAFIHRIEMYFGFMGSRIEDRIIAHSAFLQLADPTRLAERKKIAMASQTQIFDSYFEDPLEIAAPKSDFNMEGMEIKDSKLSKIEIPDPVVLQPVYHEGQKHYLIITAWGLEASDPLVVNEKMN